MIFSFKDKMFIGLDGEYMPIYIAEELAERLAKAITDQPIIAMKIALQLTANEEIDINEDELKFLKDFIYKTESFSNLAKYNILEILGEVIDFPLKEDEENENNIGKVKIE